MKSFNEWYKKKKKKTSKIKEKVIKHWMSLNYDLNKYIPITPKGKKGSSYDDDGIRITGSNVFIDSVLVRLKDFLTIDNRVDVELAIRYEATQYKHPDGSLRPSYVLYINAKERK